MKLKAKDSYQYSENLLNFDPSTNMLYLIKKDVTIQEKKSWRGKEEEEEQYANLILWDVATQQKKFLFDEETALSHNILAFYFEQRYREEEGYLTFNRQLSKINYLHLPKRAPNEVLLIETAPHTSKERCLWMCDKRGQHLQQVALLEWGWDWHLDMGNQVLRILEHELRDVNIREIPWQVPS
jgi:hypothetical protein